MGLGRKHPVHRRDRGGVERAESRGVQQLRQNQDARAAPASQPMARKRTTAQAKLATRIADSVKRRNSAGR